MLQAYRFQSLEKGPFLAITGAIHGNETCGTEAILSLIADLESGRVVLERGGLLLIPIANPRAHAENKRLIDENLNRVFYPTENPASYERRLANQLTSMISGCDMLLDLHSIHTQGWPFCMRFGMFSEAEESMIAATGLPFIVEGWAEAYAASLPQVDKGQAGHTAAYMHSLGKPAVGVECGFHDDPQSAIVGRDVIMRVLAHLGLIRRTVEVKAPPSYVLLQKVFLREAMEDKLARDFIHGEEIRRGQVLALRQDGREITASEDGMILFPRPDCPVGEEWLFTAKVEPLKKA